MPITFSRGQFSYDNESLATMNAYLRRVSDSGEKAVHEMLANVIIPPINQVIDYEEWTAPFYREYPVDLNALPRIAADSPSAVAFYTSPTGEPAFIRPGRTTYSTISLSMIDAGLEIGWDDMAMAGWPILQRKLQEVGFELARKRDELGKTCLDAAVATVAGHATTVTGGKMTKAAVDNVIKLASSAGWKLDRVVLHPTTMMDMTDWVWTNATHLWQNIEGKEAALLNNLSVPGYGGLTWNTRLYCPADTVYFAASPDVCGAYRWTAGGLRSRSDVDIRKKTDLHAWDQKLGHSWLNAYAVYSIAISD